MFACFLNMLLCIGSMTFAVLVVDISTAFQVPLGIAGLVTSIPFAMNLPCFMIAIWVYSKYTLRLGQFWATLLLLVGGWTRYVAKFDNN